MLKIGGTIIHLPIVNSTSDYLSDLLRMDKVRSGTVILADAQTRGRGQRQTKWEASPGENLTMSLFIEYDQLSVEHHTSILHWVSLAVCELLHEKNILATIKWPNDILIGSNKISGILIENAFVDKLVKHSIIGVGLNVNQQIFHNGEATSIKLETGQHNAIRRVAERFCEILQTGFEKLQNHEFDFLNEKYHSKMWKLNQEVFFIRGESEESGIVKGIAKNGMLIIETLRGIKHFDIKELKFIRERKVKLY